MCDCIDRVNAALEARNEMLDLGLRIDMKTGNRLSVRPGISVCKIDPKKRGRAWDLCAEFCPWCGEKYPED